jgi:hypothetical protein
MTIVNRERHYCSSQATRWFATFLPGFVLITWSPLLRLDLPVWLAPSHLDRFGLDASGVPRNYRSGVSGIWPLRRDEVGDCRPFFAKIERLDALLYLAIRAGYALMVAQMIHP